MLTVGSILTRALVTVSPDCPLERAQGLMREHRLRHLPVVEKKRLMGIVSERDLLERPLPRPPKPARGEAADAAEPRGAVRDRMSVSVETVVPQESASKACRRMLDRRVSSLPVVDQGSLVGILTELDFLRLYERVCRFAGHDPALDPAVETRMSHEVVVVAPSATALGAFELLRSKGIRHLPVVHDGWLVGVVSDHDLLPAVGEARGFRRVEDLMTKDFVGVVPGTPLSEVAECMLQNGFHSLPVLVEGALRGIVTSADVLQALADIDEPTLDAAWSGEAALSTEREES